MYRLKGKNGRFIQPIDNRTCQKESYELLGYGTESNSTLQTYYYPISQITDNYRQFVADMVSYENTLKAQL